MHTSGWGYANPDEEYLGGGRPNPYFGMPEIPDYSPGWDPSMSLAPEIEQRLSGINLNTEGLDRFRNEALRTGQSPWASMMEGKSRLSEMDAREAAIRDARAGTLQAESDIAGAGGLTAGARERLGQAGGRSALDMTQRAGRAGTLDRMGIGITDEQNRVNQLSMLPGMEQAPFEAAMAKENIWGRARDQDVSRELRENENYNRYIMDKYGIEGSIYGAGMTADAQAQEDPGTSFVCTELRKHGLMSKHETHAMHRFMMKSALARADVSTWYFRNGVEAIALANEADFPWFTIKERFVDDIMAFDWDDPEQLIAAQTLYAQNIHDLFTQFLGSDCGWKDSFLKPGRLKSFLALPGMISSPQVWAWSFGRMKRLLRKLRYRWKFIAGGDVCLGQ
jgi:hypothetical protein